MHREKEDAPFLHVIVDLLSQLTMYVNRRCRDMHMLRFYKWSYMVVAFWFVRLVEFDSRFLSIVATRVCASSRPSFSLVVVFKLGNGINGI